MTIKNFYEIEYIIVEIMEVIVYNVKHKEVLNMTTEEKLKALIMDRYRSIREFTHFADIPYTTMKSILERGIGNSSVNNVIKICRALHISVDELAEGKIVTITDHIIPGDLTEIKDILSDAKARLIHQSNLTLEGNLVDDGTIDAIVQGIDVSVELAKRHNKNYNKNHNKNDFD